MDCRICKTEIKYSEAFYWGMNDKDEPEYAMHSDCLIREAESTGNDRQATEIQELDLIERIL